MKIYESRIALRLYNSIIFIAIHSRSGALEIMKMLRSLLFIDTMQLLAVIKTPDNINTFVAENKLNIIQQHYLFMTIYGRGVLAKGRYFGKVEDITTNTVSIFL